MRLIIVLFIFYSTNIYHTVSLSSAFLYLVGFEITECGELFGYVWTKCHCWIEGHCDKTPETEVTKAKEVMSKILFFHI